MLWLQEYPWEQLVPSDFTTIMPNPHFNDLEEPLKLPQHRYPHMATMVYHLIRVYIEYKKFEIKPWQWKGEYYDEDIRVLEMFDTMYADALKYKEAKKRGEQAMKQHIEDEKKNAQGTTQYSSSNKGLWGGGRLSRK